MGPRAAVDGIVPVTGARGCACWNGTPYYPGVVTTLLVNAAIPGGGRSFEGPIYGGAAWGNTGARAAMGVTGCCRGTPRGRLLVGSRAVSFSRELNTCLTSSSENSLLAPFDGLVARSVVARVLNDRLNSTTRARRRIRKIRFRLLFRASACPSPRGRGRQSAGVVPCV